MAKVLVTGGAGFIGSTLSEALIARGDRIVCIDNFNDYYAPAYKRANLSSLERSDAFTLHDADICDREAMLQIFETEKPDAVFHIAAMAGVRPSIENPALYTAVNVDGLVNVLDASVASGVKQFLFASSSSVYGNNKKVPFAEDDPVDYPISPYAATKRSGELICHTYHHLYKLPIFCLRFFTVFGPRQRPDLAMYKFMHMIAEGKPIPFFGDGSTSRDYTFVGDIVEGLIKSLDACEGYRIFNIGGNRPVTLKQMVETIEKVLGKKAQLDIKPMQPGDVNQTYADLTRIQNELGYAPQTSLEEGLAMQWAWLKERMEQE